MQRLLQKENITSVFFLFVQLVLVSIENVCVFRQTMYLDKHADLAACNRGAVTFSSHGCSFFKC